jgi:hypothetical protein
MAASEPPFYGLQANFPEAFCTATARPQKLCLGEDKAEAFGE